MTRDAIVSQAKVPLPLKEIVFAIACVDITRGNRVRVSLSNTSGGMTLPKSAHVFTASLKLILAAGVEIRWLPLI